MSAVIGVVLIALASYFGAMLLGFHQVKQGYVGIYKKFGVLQQTLTEPGFHFRIPFYEEFIEMKISIQTDTVANVPCGTSNGTLVYFDKIEVISKLKKQHVYSTVLNYTENYEKFWITDKIHHEINQFCSRHSLQQIYIDVFNKLDQQLISSLNKDLMIWAPGVQILSIRMTKPNIPERIRQNFQKMQKLKVDYFISIEKQKVRVEEQTTIQKQQMIKMSSNLDVKQIDMQKKIQLKQNQLKMAEIEAQMIFQKEKTKIETQFLAAFEQASTYPALFTQKYMAYLAYDAITQNSSFAIGNQIPTLQLKQKLV